MSKDYEKEYTFNVKDYLIELYPALSLTAVKTICNHAINDPDMDDAVEEVVDQWIARQALLDAKYCTAAELQAQAEEAEDE